MINAGLFSSDRQDWETPKHLFDSLNAEFNFTLDVCAQEHNKKVDNYISPEIDGLKQSWRGNICWLNCPYGKEIGAWIEKAYLETRNNKPKFWSPIKDQKTVVVALLPARTDTKWFHKYIYGKAQVRFLEGRVKFVGGKSAAPFPSMIVVWK